MTPETQSHAPDRPSERLKQAMYGSPEAGYAHRPLTRMERRVPAEAPSEAAVQSPEQIVAGEVASRLAELQRQQKGLVEENDLPVAALGTTHADSANGGEDVMALLRRRANGAKSAIEGLEEDLLMMREGQAALREKRAPSFEFMSHVEKMEAEAAGRLSRAFEGASMHPGSPVHERGLQDARNRMASIAGLKARIQELREATGRVTRQR
jgi:hypothetical protein